MSCPVQEITSLRGASIPPSSLLGEYAPMRVWKSVARIAARSPHQRFQMGAVIFAPKTGRIYSTGWSHQSEQKMVECASVHAEHHALSRLSPRTQGLWIALWGVNAGSGGCAWSCCPCAVCARRLSEREIERVLYPQTINDGSWVVASETPEELVRRISPSHGVFARQQRISPRS